MKFKNYYKILELETNKVTIDQIKSAYRKQAKKYHPDVNVGDKLAEEKIKDINEAYRILSNPSTKRKYDRTWNYNVGRRLNHTKTSGQMAGEIFGMFFGSGDTTESIDKPNEPAVRGEDVETEIKISLEEGFYGANKTIVFKDLENKDKTITIKLPEGVQENEKIRLIGQGKPGKNGGKNGDLFIKINIQDGKKYKLKGLDIYTDLKITPWEAALGTRISVDSIDETLSLCIPQGTESGEKVRIPNKGYKDGKGGRGDLIAEVKIMIPKKMSEEEKQLFEQFNKISKYNPREA